MTLFGNRVITGALSEDEVISEQGGPGHYDQGPNEKGEIVKQTTHTGRKPCEHEVMSPQAKECLRLPEIQRVAWKRSFPGP